MRSPRRFSFVRLTRRTGVVLLAVVGATVSLVGLGAAPASAGGPTSVLVASPVRHVSASAYRTDAEYATLATALDETPAAEKGAPEQMLGPGGTQVNVSWLAHDVWVWRVDRVVLDSDGVPWINTLVSESGQIPFDQEGVWHRSPTPKKLVGLLTRWGMLGESAVGGGTGDGTATDGAATDGAATDGAATDGAATDGAATDGAATDGDAVGGGAAADHAGVAGTGLAAGATSTGGADSASRSGAAGGLPSGWAWAVLPALVVGALGGALGRPLTHHLRAARRPRKGPRQELVDV